MTVSFAGRIDSNRTACLTGSQTAGQLADGAGSVPVGVFTQFGFGILGNQTGTDGVLLIQFPCDYRLDGDAGQTQFVDVVAQYGSFSYSVAEPKGTYTPKPKVISSLALYAP